MTSTSAIRTGSLLFAAGLVCLAACENRQSRPSAPESPAEPVSERAGTGETIVTYAGETFTEGDFLDEMAKLNRRSRKSLEDPARRQQFVENLILSRLIYNEGVERGLDQDPEIRKQLADLEQRLVIQKVMQEPQSAPVEEADVRAYYDAHPEEFATDRVKASHILVKDEALAEEIHEKITADPEAFAALAEEHSIDKSNASRGGDLGYFGRGRMVTEFEEAAFALDEDGQISEIVKTRFGYHIIKRTGREDGGVRPFDEVANQIRIRLINEKRRSQTEAFLDGLKADADYEIDVDVLTAVDVSGLPEPPNSGSPRPAHGH